MDQNYSLIHLIGKILQNRRIELGINPENVSAETRLNVLEIENSNYVHITEASHLCKYYNWSLSQIFQAVKELDASQKR
jgi:hypothetical protein